jgi:HTH-type transcriptional regulator/antitoxin HigA
MDIRPIKNDRDYQAALTEIRRLWSSDPRSQDAQKVEVLAMLAQSYERAREPLPAADPVEAIKFRMEQSGLSRKDLLPIFGTTARISEVLNAKRPLTLEMVRRLHFELGIPLESLVAPPKKPRRRPPTGGRPPGARGHRARRAA